MLMYRNDIDFENSTAHLTRIDGFNMVNDLYYLQGLGKKDLPLDINRDWHPMIHDYYKMLLSGEKELSPGTRIHRNIYNFNFYVYVLEPIDDWEGYYQLFLEDLISGRNWSNLLYDTLWILRKHSPWELDISSGPYVSMLPGTEMNFSHWVVLVKQENNGTTFLVSQYNLEYLKDSLINVHVANRR